jgi:hypothetical protein
VLELSGPAPWQELAAVWQGVQADLQLPGPAIAVSGSAYQLWFSVDEAIAAARASAFLAALRRHYLGDVPQERITLLPGESAAPSVARLPPLEIAAGRWSAFVTPDLAALFGDEPWLDMTPPADAQAELLARLQPMKAAELEQALERLAPVHASNAPTGALGAQDPRRFLLDVMNDRSVDLQLRIEAAKALLAHGGGERGG